jgi:hypothetical protein
MRRLFPNRFQQNLLVVAMMQQISQVSFDPLTLLDKLAANFSEDRSVYVTQSQT